MTSTLANHLASAFAVAVCFWVTRTYALKSYPYGVPVAVLWAILGVSLMVAAVARYLTFELGWFLVSTKLALAGLGVVTIVRECAGIDLSDLLRGMGAPIPPFSKEQVEAKVQWRERKKAKRSSWTDDLDRKA